MMKRFLAVAICLLLAALPCFAAITLTQSRSSASPTVAGGSVNLAFSSSVTANHLLIYGCAVFASGNPPGITITDNNTNTITLINTAHSNLVQMDWDYVLLSHSGSTTVTCATSTGFNPDIDVIIEEWAGFTSPALDQQTHGGAADCSSGCFPQSQTTSQPGAITTTSAIELILTYVYDVHSSHGWTINSSFTIDQTTNNSDGTTSSMAYLTVSSIQTGLNPTWTNTGAAGQINSAIASFKETATPSSGFPMVVQHKRYRFKGGNIRSTSLNDRIFLDFPRRKT